MIDDVPVGGSFIESLPPEAPLSASPPPLFDAGSFSNWMTEVFTDEHVETVLDKLSSVPGDDDMAKMRLLLNEEAAYRRSTVGDPVVKSYSSPKQGDGMGEAMVIAFGGENNRLVS